MILELKVPNSNSFESLISNSWFLKLRFEFCLLPFTEQPSSYVSYQKYRFGSMANIFCFWLSLIPFGTIGLVLRILRSPMCFTESFCSCVPFPIFLQNKIIALEGEDSFYRAVKSDIKKRSWAVIFATRWLLLRPDFWLIHWRCTDVIVPDKRIEKKK